MKRVVVGLVVGWIVVASTPVAHATFAGVNGRIVWVKNGHVVSVEPDGADFRKLTDGANDYMGSPTCSADGRFITFSGQTATLNYDIWVVRTTGSNLHRVTDDATEDTTPAFSPDGRWIVFSRDRGGSANAIFTMKTDGSHRRVLFEDAGDQDTPRYSPNGRTIVFQSDESGLDQLWTMHADGSHAHAITSGARQAYFPNWSPTGKRLTYIENNFTTTKIVSLLPDGTGRRVLKTTVASVDSAVLSPSGTKLAITDGGPQLLYTQPVGGPAKPIGDHAMYTSLDWCVAP